MGLLRDEVKALKNFVDGRGYITRKEIATFMGYKDPRSIDAIIWDLKKAQPHCKRYNLEDVAINMRAFKNRSIKKTKE